MKSAILKLSDFLHSSARVVAISCIIIMLVTMMIQVVSRYVFKAPPIWTDEVARYMMVWSGLLGATMSFKERSDAVLLESVMPPRPHLLGWFADIMHSLAVAVFLCPIIYFSLFDLHGTFGRGFLGRQALLEADTLRFPMVWVAVAVPLCATIILVHLLDRWFRDPDSNRADASSRLD